MADGNSLIPINDEQAKLIQEVLKTIRGLGSFFEKALGSTPEDLFGYLGGDWLRVRRAENIAKMMSCAKERLEARGVKDTKPASLTLALPILRGAADESREELRDLWARLLAAAMDPYREKDIRLGFAEAIQKMDPLDARVLVHISNREAGISDPERNNVSTELGVSLDELSVSLSNLEKIGMAVVLHPLNQPMLRLNTVITPFGREFLRVLMD
ncbi:MAG: Abi-alpha family protein [Syntrophobacteraceae bacterium]